MEEKRKRGRPRSPEFDFAPEEKRERGRPERVKYETARRGRPRKGEIVVRPFVVHNRPDTKEENKLEYAKDAIRRADALYRRYERDYPNPLNIDDKKLHPMARATWEYIFSTRDYDGIPSKDKMFRDTEEILYCFESFCAYIRDNNFMKEITRVDGSTGGLPIVPNKTNFARWMGVSVWMIERLLANDLPARERYRQMLSDLLSEGAMIGAYSSASAIFTLKNCCGWADSPDDREINRNAKEFVPVEEAEKALAELGYTRPKLLE